mmetsp:Transcript_20411/g.51946  ORF Transcript_20411/g.51946 Transcript_20411/m.51946 type:complete len:251 (+) Transcript_20411:112-864(+)
MPPATKKENGITWSAVQRDGITLAECGEDNHGGAVLALAKKILSKKPSPGWEFDKSGKLAAVKFHVHESSTVWTACCVYVQGAIPEIQAKGFLEKIILLSEPLRMEPAWRTGGMLAAQDSFAPTLLQRMEQANSGGKIAMVSQQVNEVKEVMSNNIEMLLERGQKLEDLEDKATFLGKMSQQFHKGARSARRFQMWQQAKFGMATGTAVTVGVAAVSVPPLVAAMGPAGWAVGGSLAVGAGTAVGVKMGR